MTAAAATAFLPAQDPAAPADDGALITIVGAGFTGTAIAVQQIHAYLAAWEGQRDAAIPPLTLRLIDKSGQVGPGLPYATADDIFLLNQPAWAMSPFPQDPAHFTRWRAENGYGNDPDAFERRSVYGRYLKDIFTQAVRRAADSGAPLTIETVNATIGTLSFRPDGSIALETQTPTTQKKDEEQHATIKATATNSQTQTPCAAQSLAPSSASSSVLSSVPSSTPASTRENTPASASILALTPAPSSTPAHPPATSLPPAKTLSRASDAVILADGHQKSALLKELRGDEYYFEPPFSIAALREKLENRDGTVVIVGTSQTMLDALAALDHIGWRGNIRAVSRDLVLPWAFHPSHYGPDSGYAPYAPGIVTAAAITAQATATTEKNISAETAAHDLIQKELERAAAQGYDTGHVVTGTALYTAIDEAAQNPACAALCRALRDRLAKIYSNPTPPQRYALFRRWLDSGRLSLSQEAVTADKIEKTSATTNGAPYKLHTADGTLRLTAVFNGACFTRDALASPLLRQTYESGALRWNAQTAQPEAGQQTHPGLYVAGPAAHRDKWGVETFRDECRDAARDSLSHALSRHRAATTPTPS